MKIENCNEDPCPTLLSILGGKYMKDPNYKSTIADKIQDVITGTKDLDFLTEQFDEVPVEK